MKHRTRSVVAVMLVVLTPGLARGGGPSAAPVPDVSVLSEEVATLAATEGPAAAARLSSNARSVRGVRAGGVSVPPIAVVPVAPDWDRISAVRGRRADRGGRRCCPEAT